MGEKETPTHSGRCIFYTLGIKMEPTRPTDSLVNHFYTTRVENASPTHVGGSFLKSGFPIIFKLEIYILVAIRSCCIVL